MSFYKRLFMSVIKYSQNTYLVALLILLDLPRSKARKIIRTSVHCHTITIHCMLLRNNSKRL